VTAAGDSIQALLDLLAARQAAAAADIDRIRTQITALTEQLTAAQETLSRLSITCQTVTAMLTDDDPTTHAAEPTHQSRSPVDDPLLSQASYRQILAAFEQTDTGLRAKDLCRALDTGTAARHVEAMRAKLKRLVGRHILTESEPGLFVIVQRSPASRPTRAEPR
jgi:uncharacterized coiled-coil protein SlyX